MIREQARGLNRDQRNAFVAAWLGWAMDAFDYFLLVFVISDVAETFDTSKTKVAIATTLTLAARPVGAALFGYWADKKGRRPARSATGPKRRAGARRCSPACCSIRPSAWPPRSARA